MTPATSLGTIADPLVAVSPKKLSPISGNHPFWITVKTPAGTPAGNYKGTLIIQGKGRTSMAIPLTLSVCDFELPEYSTFRTHTGGQYIAKAGKTNVKSILGYHGLKTKEELKKLARKYYDLMSINKFYPKTVALFSEIGMNWSPPPEGYNVDKPGNYFKLYDWDFTEFNRDLNHYIDELKVNSVCLTHTNPVVSNIFKHLPGTELKQFELDPPHGTMAWQTFRDHKFVAWDKRKGESDELVEITRDQWDHLGLDYYRTIAKNLEQHGWLDRVYILIDERHNIERLLHFLRVLKSDPITARIRIVACMQGLEYFYHKEPGTNDYTFKDLLTYMPQFDEGYNRWEKYYFTDYDIAPDRDKLWNYGVDSSRIAIDAPGINNRIIALDIFNRGGSGFLIWDTFMWEHGDGDSNNPWKDPYSRSVNGTLSFFYPPSKDGSSKSPDYTIVPSLRVMTYRESVNDYEYAKILEDLIAAGEKKGVDVSEGKAILLDIDRFFYNSVHWSQNDAWYLDLREKMANTIVKLQHTLK